MRKILMMVLLVVAGVVVYAEPKAEKKAPKTENKVEKKISLAEARGRIDRAIENPKVMEELTKGLSAEDQRQFLADVNKAISGLAGSAEEKTALFLNANSAAMRSTPAENLKPMVAEVFATVPPESLTVIAERFAIDLFNRDAGGAGKYTDAEFTKVATETMKTVNERTAQTDNGSARSAFAIIMFIRASNGSIPDLSDTLIDTLEHADAQEMARTEWIPSALGKDGRTQGYEPLLASADAGRRPDLAFVLVIAGPQHPESVLADLIGKNTDQMALMDTRTPVLDAVDNKLIAQNPTLGADALGQAGEAGDIIGGGEQEITPGGPGEDPHNPRPTPDEPDPVNPTPHPDPYPGQS